MSNDIDIEHRLDEIEEKVDQNFKILQSIKRKQTFEFWFGIVKILVFIGAFYSLYVFIEPILTQVLDAYLKLQGLSDSIGTVQFNLPELLKNFQAR